MKTLAVKYRPKTFDDVVEQGSIRKILEFQIQTKTHKNCYLFTGGAGTGKTTCARIFANEINGQKGNPIEIDAASNNGVENVREIIDQSKFKALDAPYKVYIIDECHMLSTGAWNALLKLLEEPPAQTIFILCTTDPQKIPNTILSRVQRYDFHRITFVGVVQRLTHIMQLERAEAYDRLLDEGGDDKTCMDADSAGYYSWTDEALEYIAKLADGGMRDAITLLDKCLSYSDTVSMESVVAALGTSNYKQMFELLQCILDRWDKEAILIIEQAYQEGIDLKQMMKQFTAFLVDIIKYDMLGNFDYLMIPSNFDRELEMIATVCDGNFNRVREWLKIQLQLNAEIKWEQTPKQLIEATIIAYCTNQ